MKTKVMIAMCTQIGVEQTKNNGRSHPCLYLIRDLIQGTFHKGFHVCIDQASFLTNSELKIN
jgi:hypothetical protein